MKATETQKNREIDGMVRQLAPRFGIEPLYRVGVSPLHPPTGGVNSRYAPSSRLFLNPLYVNIERIPEFQTTPALQEPVRSTSGS